MTPSNVFGIPCMFQLYHEFVWLFRVLSTGIVVLTPTQGMCALRLPCMLTQDDWLCVLQDAAPAASLLLGVCPTHQSWCGCLQSAPLLSSIS